MNARNAAVLVLALVGMSTGCGWFGGPSLLGGGDSYQPPGTEYEVPGPNNTPRNPGETDLSIFEEGKGSTAATPEERLEENARNYAWVTVSWEGAEGSAAVNLDLHVENANGVEIFYLNTGDGDEGAFAPHDECTSFDCSGDEENPRESVVWEIEKLVPGNYRAWVENASDNNGTFEIEIVAGEHRVNETNSVAANSSSDMYYWTVEGEQTEDPNAPCLEQLDQLGVNYDRITISEGSCRVEDAVMVNGPVNGVTYRVDYARSTTRFRTACKTAVALHKLGNILKAEGVNEVRHNGSYNCRSIGSSNTPSQHSYALAMDFNGFAGGGKEYSVIRHWEHNTSSPSTPQGKVLYNIAHKAHEQGIFNVILTPNYNAAHDDHIHMDLGSGNTIRSNWGGEQEPVSYLDEVGFCEHDEE